MAIPNALQLITEFRNAYQNKYAVAPPLIQHHLIRAGQPHLDARITPPKNESWVYAFSTTSTALCSAGANKALRVGRTASFGRISQHYGGGGTTASALVQQLSSQYFHWSYLGLNQVASSLNNQIATNGWQATWGNWVKNNLDRDIFVVPPGQPQVLGELEKFIRGRLGPVFEG